MNHIILAGPICEGFECTPLLLALIVAVALPVIALAGLLIGGIGLVVSRKGESGHKPVFTGVFAVGAIAALMVGGWFFSRFRSNSNYQKTVATALDNLPFTPFAPKGLPSNFDLNPEFNSFRDPPYLNFYMRQNGEPWLTMEQFEFKPAMAVAMNPPAACDPEYVASWAHSGSSSRTLANKPCRLLATTANGRDIWGVDEPAARHWYVRIDETVIFLERSYSPEFRDTFLQQLPPFVESLEKTTPRQLGIYPGQSPS